MPKNRPAGWTPAFAALVALGIALAFGCRSSEPPQETTPAVSRLPGDDAADEAAEPAPETVADTESDAAAGDTVEPMVTVDVTLPQPRFKGTPKHIKFGENIEKPSTKRRPPPRVPEGADQNVALRKPVTSSDMAPIIGELELVTDGDKEALEGSFVELGPMLQHVQIDLGRPCEIHAILLWHYHGEGRVYHDIVVQLADDPDFISNVRTLYNNDYDNSSGLGLGKDLEYLETYEGRLIQVGGATGRYLRLYSNGNTSNEMNHYTEVEVYGKPAS